jgi:drebrin-like protein
MNLVEGEFITDIEEVDEGWWTGVGSGGKTGLFPCKPFAFAFFVSRRLSFDLANYVEVVHQAEALEEEPVEVAAAPPPPPPPPPPPVSVFRCML